MGCYKKQIIAWDIHWLLINTYINKLHWNSKVITPNLFGKETACSE